MKAALLGEDDSEPGRMGAVVLADLAVEIAAKAAVLGDETELDYRELLPHVNVSGMGSRGYPGAYLGGEKMLICREL
jgi:hypothetical protein